MKRKVKSKPKQVVLAIAIALVLVFFVGYGISVFYEEPEFEDFCGEEPKISVENILNESSCLGQGGQWTPWGASEVEIPREVIPKGEGHCDMFFECRQEYDDSRDVYNRNVFIIALILGLAIVVTGITLKLESVSIGIMGGGALLILYGTIRYWGELGKYIRLVILGLVLVALIYLGYKKFGKK